MELLETLERFAGCLTADADSLGVAEISALMADVLACQGALDHVLVSLSAAADRLASDWEAPSGPGGEWLLRGARLSNHQASRVAGRALVAEVFPMFAAALAAGEVRAEHLDALGGVLPDVHPDRVPVFTDAEMGETFLAFARRHTPTELAREARGVARLIDEQAGETEAQRIRRQRRLRFVRHHDGTVSVHGNLGAEGGEVRRMVEAEAARLRAAEKTVPDGQRSSDEQLTADALVSLIRGGATHGGVTAPVNPTCIVQMTLEDLVELFRSQWTHATTSDGLPVTAEFVRGLIPTARLVPVLLDQSGLPIELAKDARKRLATMIQRAVLSAMYDTCIVPGCDTPFDDCEVHHFADYDGKNTTLANLGPVCKHDHHEHHAGRRTISIDADRNVTVTLADGTIWAAEAYRPPGRGQPPSGAG